MRRHRREVGIPMLLGAGAFALAFVQRPGLATADTKINLHVDPGRFLADVGSMWTSTGQLGDVQSGQQAGYLFPMGPVYSLGHAIGLSDWVVQRMWLGALLALAAWGVVRLLDALLDRPRGLAHLVAGIVVLLNPFVVTYANRTTVTLLAYAALPWLLLAVHRGLRDREGRRWRWPAAFALLVTASGGGINGAVTAWMLLGPALLLLYEPAFVGVRWRSAGAFLVRAVPLTAIVSLWWVVPAYIQSAYGIDFLHFTEQPGTIWGTTSATETLRLMSFWLSYVGIGFTGRAIPYFDDSRTLLFSPAVVVATLLLPAGALAGFVWTRRWRYGPFFLGLALVAVLVMMAGFPGGTPLRHGLTFTYNHVAAVRFLRASYKAAPLLAIALACLAGAGAGEAATRLSKRRWRLPGLPRPAAWAAGASIAAGALAVTAVAAWPMVTGHAQDDQVSYKAIPAAWRAAARDLDRELPANSRAMVLPGDLFSFYTWGGTVDPILPALASRPVAERSEVPYSDLHATDLLWTIDGLVHQRRLLPGQLPPLLSLIGVREVITPTDDDLARSDAPAPADAAAELAGQAGFARPARIYGPLRRFASSGLAAPVTLPEVRRYDLPSARGLVRVESSAQPTVVDGSASALAELAAFGALPAARPLLYSGELSSAQVRAELARGGQLVISDSNRRQAFVAASLEQNTGPTLTPGESVSADGIMLDPFGRGPGFETVAAYTGVRDVQAPSSPEVPQFPEHAPFAAVDGSPQTAWLADPTLDPGQRWLQVDFLAPRDVPYVSLLPYGDAGGTVEQVQIAGRTFSVHAGWNRLALGLRGATSLRVTLTSVSAPLPGHTAGAGGISELRIPGVHVGERLRLPGDAAAAVSGRDLDGMGLTYLFVRTTGDDPFQRNVAHGPWSAQRVADAGDAEQAMQRVFEVPATRRFDADAWVTVSAQASDATLDRLAGYHGPVVATSSSRFEGEPRWRASQALDGDLGTAWIADYDASSPAWLQWRTPRSTTVTRLRLVAPDVPVRFPTRVRLSWPGGTSGVLPVTADGRVTLTQPVRATVFRLQVVGTSVPSGATAADRRAVGIAEVQGVAALAPILARRASSFSAPCSSTRVRVGASTVSLRVSGTAAAFATGAPLRAVGCGAPVPLAAGSRQLAVVPGTFLVDDLRLASPAPRPVAAPATSGRVLNPGTAGRGSYDHVRVAVTGPSWLVLGESYDRGWHASCNGRDLGSPTLIDGYANAWRVRPGCRDVSFTFTPNRLAAIGYLLSLIAGVVCLLLVAPWPRYRRAGARAAAEPGAIPNGPVAAWSARSAALAGVLAGCAFGFVFGVEAGAVAAVVAGLVLWRGVGARVLTLAAAVLLAIVVPVLYLADPGDQQGGNHFGYAMDHLAAHWVGVAALGLLMGALWRTLRAARRRPAPVPDADSPEPRPVSGYARAGPAG